MENSFSIGNRIFRLSNGEQVDPALLEEQIRQYCHYVKYVTLTEDEGKPVAFIFADPELLANPDYFVTPEKGCFCPRNLDELGRCLSGCLKFMNDHSGKRIKAATIIHTHVNEIKGSLAPGLLDKCKETFKKMGSGKLKSDGEVYVISLDTK